MSFLIRRYEPAETDRARTAVDAAAAALAAHEVVAADDGVAEALAVAVVHGFRERGGAADGSDITYPPGSADAARAVLERYGAGQPDDPALSAAAELVVATVDPQELLP